jgi:hypothetical protein
MQRRATGRPQVHFARVNCLQFPRRITANSLSLIAYRFAHDRAPSNSTLTLGMFSLRGALAFNAVREDIGKEAS